MAFGLSAGAVAAMGAVGGALISSNAAGNAADAQSEATAASNAELREQRRQTREDLAPWRTGGSAANSKLLRLLGVGGDSASLREQLLSRYTTPGTPGTEAREMPVSGHEGEWMTTLPGTPGTPGQVDENGLQAAINAQTDTGGDYGSLLRDFTGKDLASEPGYQFGLEQGEQGVNRAAASRGSFLSGAALKALGRFNTDYAGTKFGEAFSRDATNKQRAYGFLTGVSQQGQSAAAGTGASGLAIADAIGKNTTAMGNAQGASTIAQGNQWSGALKNINEGYQQNALMQKIQAGNASWGGGSGGWYYDK